MPLGPVQRALLWGLATLAAGPGRAGEARADRRAVATRLAPGSLRVDGDPGDEGWRAVPWNEGFTQVTPEEGKAASEATRFKVAIDGQRLFVLVEADDSRPDEVKAQLTRRDQWSSSDWIEVLLDTFGDRRTAYHFRVNPLGVRMDGRIGADNVEDVNWDAVWEAKVARTAAGWRVELSLPLGQLRWPAEGSTWGVQVQRVLSRRAETATFNPVPRSEVFLARRFARLDVGALPSPWRLELSPYASAGVEVDGGDYGPLWGLGLDGRVGLGPTFTLDVTVNPDFGQVEADPSELNLSAFETYFAEKRPFFLEGADQLRFALAWGEQGQETLFYSRRVGRAPERDPEDFGEVRQAPSRAAILGALKLTGRTSDGWALGVMDAVTRAEFADLRIDGEDRRLLVEPFTQLAVLRATKDLRQGQTQVGVLATHAYRRLAFDAASFFPEHAASGGIDLDHRWSDWQLTLKLYGTHLAGSPEAIDRVQRSSVHYLQRPDRDDGYDPRARSLSGWGTMLLAGKLSGAPLRGAAGIWTRSPGLDPNDLGYLPAADEQTGMLWLQYRDDEPGPGHQSWRANADLVGTRTFQGELTRLYVDLNGVWNLPDTSYVYAGLERKFAALDPRALRGGPALALPASWIWWGGVGTDDRRKWSVGFDTDGQVYDEGAGSYAGLWLWGTVRPWPSLDVTLGPQYRKHHSPHQWASDLAGPDGLAARWYVGGLIRDTLALTLRVSWAITPELSLQWYAMPYLTAGTYSGFAEVVAPRAERYADRFSAIDPAFAADTLGLSDRFLYAQVRSNLVLRWEFRAGSTLFVVWTHEQTDDREDSGKLGWDEAGRLFDQPSSDAVMVKLAWWWSR